MPSPAQPCINDTSEEMCIKGNISLGPSHSNIKQASQSGSLHQEKDFLSGSVTEDNSNIAMEYNNESTENKTDSTKASDDHDPSLEVPGATLQEVNGTLQSKNAEGSKDSGIYVENEDVEVQNDDVELVDDEQLEASDRDGLGGSTTEKNTVNNEQTRSPSNGFRIVRCDRGDDVTRASHETLNPSGGEPSLSDCRVGEVEAGLKETFNVDDVIALLRETGEVVYIAVNILAQHVTYQSAVLPCLFDVLKVCDAWNLMLTSYKINSNDIIERLHIACLKFVEGFPDFAMSDIQQIGEYVSRMSDAIKKMQVCLVDAMNALMRVETLVGDDDILERSLEEDVVLITKRNGIFDGEGEEHRRTEEEYRLIRRRFKNALYLKLFADSPTEACKLSAEESYQDLQRQGDVIRRSSDPFRSDNDRFEIARMSLQIAHQKYCKVATLLEQATILVGTWYNECRSILDSDFGVLINRTKEMTERERQVFFEGSSVMIQLKLYLQRWRSVYKSCSENLSCMRPVRDEVEQLYTENPYPVEAVERSRRAAVKHPELRKVLNLPDRFEPIPWEGALYKVGNRMYALELILEAKNSIKPNNLGGVDERNPFQSDEYIEAKKVMDLSEKLLQIAYETAPRLLNYRKHIRGMCRSFVRVKQAVYENILQYREEAASIAIHLYLECLSWLQGLPEFAKDGFNYGVLDIEGLNKLGNAISSKSLTCDTDKLATSLETYKQKALDGLIEGIKQKTEERCDSETVEWSHSEDDQAYHTLCLSVIEDHIGDIDNVKQAAISAEALNVAKGLPLVGVVGVHCGLGRHIEQLFQEKQRLLVEVDPIKVYVRNGQGDSMMDHGWMRRVHDLCQRLNAFRLSCEEETALLEEEHHSNMLLSTRSTGEPVTLDECENMVERLGDMALVESFRKVRTAIDGKVLKCLKVEGENLAEEASPLISIEGGASRFYSFCENF